MDVENTFRWGEPPMDTCISSSPWHTLPYGSHVPSPLHGHAHMVHERQIRHPYHAIKIIEPAPALAFRQDVLIDCVINLHKYALVGKRCFAEMEDLDMQVWLKSKWRILLDYMPTVVLYSMDGTTSIFFVRKPSLKLNPFLGLKGVVSWRYTPSTLASTCWWKLHRIILFVLSYPTSPSNYGWSVSSLILEIQLESSCMRILDVSACLKKGWHGFSLKSNTKGDFHTTLHSTGVIQNWFNDWTSGVSHSAV